MPEETELEFLNRLLDKRLPHAEEAADYFYGEIERRKEIITKDEEQ